MKIKGDNVLSASIPLKGYSMCQSCPLFVPEHVLHFTEKCYAYERGTCVLCFGWYTWKVEAIPPHISILKFCSVFHLFWLEDTPHLFRSVLQKCIFGEESKWPRKRRSNGTLTSGKVLSPWNERHLPSSSMGMRPQPPSYSQACCYAIHVFLRIIMKHKIAQCKPQRLWERWG